MTDKKTGGPAFPCEGGQRVTVGNDLRKTLPSQGMTLRDYFAAKVLAGAMVSARGLDVLDNGTLLSVAKQCYRVADAMLEARQE